MDTYLLLVAISAMVATAGLLLNSAAIVVGSMVIAPLVGPAMATSVGSVLYDQDLFYGSLRYQVLGFGLAVASATLFAFLVKFLFLVPPNLDVTGLEQVAGRLSPDLLSLAVALGAGVAGARSLSSDISTALVGVMMAAALVPPVAAMGIGIAWQLPNVTVQAGLLVLVNILSINLTGLMTLWHAGYRPTDRFMREEAQHATRQRFVLLLVAVIALSTVLAAFTVTAYRTGAASQSIESNVEGVLDNETYANVTLVDVTVEYSGDTIGSRPSRVVVTVTRPVGRTYPQLYDRLDRRIEELLGRDIQTQVRFVDVVT